MKQLRKLSLRKMMVAAVLAVALLGAGCATRIEETAEAAQVPQGEVAELTATDILRMLDEGRYDAVWEIFDVSVQEVIPDPSDLADVWSQLVEITGPNIHGRIVDVVTSVELEMGLEINEILSALDSPEALLSTTIIFSDERRVMGFFFDLVPNHLFEGVASDLFTEESVIVGAGGAFPLDAMLTMPKNAAGPVPAVVLVHGSGPNDMDSTIMAIRPFRDIAHYLAEQGVAVLRYNKRTFTHGELMYEKIGADLTVFEETIEDAVLAKDVLLADSRIDPERIYVLGLSLGGMLAPEIATIGDFAGFILMAGTQRSLPSLMVEQIEYVAGIPGWIPEADAAMAMLMAQAVYDEYLAARALPIEEARALGISPVMGVSPYYFINLTDRVNADFIVNWTRPALILHGDHDYQVRYYIDFAAYLDLTANMPNVRTILYPGLTHLFTQSFSETGMGTPMDYAFPGHVAPEVLRDIASFILGE